jgi:hypothetical protein
MIFLNMRSLTLALEKRINLFEDINTTLSAEVICNKLAHNFTRQVAVIRQVTSSKKNVSLETYLPKLHSILFIVI